MSWAEKYPLGLSRNQYEIQFPPLSPVASKAIQAKPSITQQTAWLAPQIIKQSPVQRLRALNPVENRTVTVIDPLQRMQDFLEKQQKDIPEINNPIFLQGMRNSLLDGKKELYGLKGLTGEEIFKRILLYRSIDAQMAKINALLGSQSQ